MKTTKCPLIDEWIKGLCYKYRIEYYSAIKENEIMPFEATWIVLEMIILSEISQRKTRQISYEKTYIWNLNMTQTNLSTKQI